MPHDVIMPALGMAQDSGLIVSWLKNAGDAVSVDDPLFEVETDKATMEVAAGHDGFVAALLAEAGQEVPVGEIVAVISAEKPDAPVSRAANSPPPAQTAPPEPAQIPAPKASAPPARHNTLAPQPGGRILASPKTRRLAIEQGLDLSRLVAAGHPQPFHVCDLDELRKLPDATTLTSAPTQYRRITATIPTSGFTDFLAFSRTENNGPDPTPSHLMAAFATSALREANDPKQPIQIRIETLFGPNPQLVDTDRFNATIQPENTQVVPHLILRDLTSSTITSLSLGPSKAPVLSVVANGEAYEITLVFTDAQLPDTLAIALITGFADRLSDPLRQLL